MIGGVVLKKSSRFNDNIVEILLGTLLISFNNFNDGMLLEKIFVLLGFIILIIGIVRTTMKYKEQNKKGMMIFLIIMGLISVVTFLGLLYRFIFV